MDHVRTQIPMIDRQGVLTPGAIAVDFRTRVFATAEELALGLPFARWLADNWTIWDTFFRLADKMRTRGRRYYAARTVIEVMRWNYHLSDAMDPDFKLNNNWTPKMARLYNAVTGVEFFQTRDHAGKVPLV